MATIIRYVNTASSGGDGTTNNTSGGTAAYASLSAALAAEIQTLTGVTCDVNDEEGNATIAMDILCSGTAADSTAVLISSASWVTDATHRLRIRLNGTGAGAKWDTNLYRLTAAAAYNEGTLGVNAAIFLTLQDLQVESTSSISNRPAALRLYNVAYDVHVVRGFYRQTSTTGTIDGSCCGIRDLGAGASTLMLQNVTSVAADGQGYYPDTNSTATAVHRFYNCTMVNRSATARSVFTTNLVAAAECRMKNLLIQGTGTSNYTAANGALDEEVTILTQDTTSPTVGLRSKTITFVDATNWDYHLASGDTDAIGAGTDLSSDTYWPFSTDGDGGTRSSWDVGADEYGSPGASVTLEQEGFRWVQDDGDEDESTFTAAQDTSITAAAGTTKRLRVLVNATGDPATKQYKLQWRLSGGSWADVT